MSKLRLNLGLVLFVCSLFVFSSCSKDATDGMEEIDVDNKGHFAITINYDEYTGTEVYNAGGFGVRTISASSDNFKLNLACLDSEFKAGSSIELKDSDDTVITIEYTFDGEKKTLFGVEGTMTVESLSKVKIDATFYDSSSVSGIPFKVTGFVSSK